MTTLYAQLAVRGKAVNELLKVKEIFMKAEYREPTLELVIYDCSDALAGSDQADNKIINAAGLGDFDFSQIGELR